MQYITVFFILIAFVVSYVAYPSLPFQMVTHWNMYGIADGYSMKQFGAFFLPILMSVMTLLLYTVPSMDPLKKNIRSFWPVYEKFILVFALFFLYLHILVITWNLGFVYPFVKWLLPAFSLLFYTTSSLLKLSKRNWFIGIRTPWTLADDRVWKKTHHLGSVLFRLVAICTLVGIFVPTIAFPLFLCVITLADIIPLVYSYFIYKQLQ